MSRYLFYLSYARANDDPYLRKFFGDLSEAVRQLYGSGLHEPVGFVDQRIIAPGSGWDAEVADALGNCQTMVCIYSPAYFKSEYCGKEWRILQMRRELYVMRERAEGNQNAARPPVIKPVLWIPIRDGRMPKAVADTEYVVGDPGSPYNRDGLRTLLALSKYRDEYRDFLNRLAIDVLDTTHGFELPPLDPLPRLDDVPSAFHQPSDAEPEQRPLPAKGRPFSESLPGRVNTNDSMADTGAPAGPPDASPEAARPFSGVFISYRRNEAAAYARGLYDRLSAHFGTERVFLDMEKIGWGEDFVDVITAAAQSCAVMIALISPQWSRGAGGQDQVDDYVRLEVGTALDRKIRVIPVLTQGAAMPDPKDLPEDLSPLVRRNALALSDTRWDRDVRDLIESLEKLLGR